MGGAQTRTCTSRAPRLAEERDDARGGRAPHDAVVHHHNALPAEHFRQGVELVAHAELAEPLVRLDERPAHIAVLDEPIAERDSGLLRVADGGGVGRLRHRDDDVSIHRMGPCERHPHTRSRGMREGAVQYRVRASEVDVLEDAVRLARIGHLRWDAPQAGAADDDGLTRLDVAHELRSDMVQCAAFRRDESIRSARCGRCRAGAHRAGRGCRPVCRQCRP